MADRSAVLPLVSVPPVSFGHAGSCLSDRRAAMNMPGFTAESTLYRTSAQYNTTLTYLLATAEGNVMPQQVMPPALIATTPDPLFCLAACFCCASTGHPWCCARCHEDCGLTPPRTPPILT